MADNVLLYRVTYKDGTVLENLGGIRATNLFYEAQGTDNPCTVTFQNITYKAP